MTQTPVAPTPDDILVDDDTDTARLDRAAADILAEDEARTFARNSSLRHAVREDLHGARVAARARAEKAREAVVDAPMKSVLYAAGIGVLIGLLISR